MSPPLMDDLIHDILLPLGVKDVLRFRCLSKSLCTKIDSPAFVAAHNQSVETKTRRRWWVFLGKDFDGYKGIDLDDENHNHGLIELNKPYDRYYQILCSCNGLILFGNDNNGKLLLWNPFARRSKKVPYTTYNHRTYVGLGYDSTTNDYKVVTLHRSKARVFHLATNTWTEVPIETTFQNLNFGCLSKVGVFANGALHWISYYQNYAHSFNISKQEFVNVLPPIPPPLHFHSLQFLGGRLLLGTINCMRTNELYEVVDDGNGSTWRKLYTIDMTKLYTRVSAIDKETRKPGICRLQIILPFKFLELSNDGEKILLQYFTSRRGLPDANLCWYDLQHGTFEHVQILRDVDLIYRHGAFVCWESLDSFMVSPQAWKRKREIIKREINLRFARNV